MLHNAHRQPNDAQAIGDVLDEFIHAPGPWCSGLLGMSRVQRKAEHESSDDLGSACHADGVKVPFGWWVGVGDALVS